VCSYVCLSSGPGARGVLFFTYALKTNDPRNGHGSRERREGREVERRATGVNGSGQLAGAPGARNDRNEAAGGESPRELGGLRQKLGGADKANAQASRTEAGS